MSHHILVTGCLALLAAALAFGGCLQSDNTTTVAPIVPPAESGDPFIVYQRSGGLTGMDDRLCIYSGGGCELYRKNGVKYTCPVFSLKLRRLEQSFEDAGFFSLPAEYPGSPQANAVRYSIDYMAKGLKHRVTACSDSLPDPLVPLVRELDQCVLLVSIAGVRAQP